MAQYFKTKGLTIKVTSSEEEVVELEVFSADSGWGFMSIRKAKRHHALMGKAIEYASKEQKRLTRLKYKRQSRAAIV